MTGFPRSPRTLKGGIVLIDPRTSAVLRVVTLQYNPDTVTRSLQMQSAGDGADLSEALRLKGPPIETIKIEAEWDLTDQLASAEPGSAPARLGLQPQLADLETLVYPKTSQLETNNALAQAGTLEIVPLESPLTLFVWSRHRILPVRITELSITEEAFDPSLNPLRAKVSLGLRVLTVDDLGFDNKAGNIFLAYLRNKEQLAAKYKAGPLAALGITGIP